jgi:hypothetical protein
MTADLCEPLGGVLAEPVVDVQMLSAENRFHGRGCLPLRYASRSELYVAALRPINRAGQRGSVLSCVGEGEDLVGAGIQ